MRQGKHRKTRGGKPQSGLPHQVVVRDGDIAAVADDAAGVDADAVDLEKYLIHLAHLDMPLALKIELIRAVGDIMQSFVDRAFGDDAVQQALRADSRENKDDALVESEVVELQQPQIQKDCISENFRLNAGNKNKNEELP